MICVWLGMVVGGELERRRTTNGSNLRPKPETNGTLDHPRNVRSLFLTARSVLGCADAVVVLRLQMVRVLLPPAYLRSTRPGAGWNNGS